MHKNMINKKLKISFSKGTFHLFHENIDIALIYLYS